MRLGDVTGNYIPEGVSSRIKNRTSEIFTEVSAEQGAEISVPAVLENETAVESADITAEFDENILELTGVTLSGGILEKGGYNLEFSADVPGELSATVFALSEPITGSGTLVTLNFRVTGDASDGAVIRLKDFSCNEIPVYDAGTEQSFVLRLKPEELMQYDLNHDKKVGLQDALFALSIGDLKTAIRVLQILTGM